MAQRKLLNDSTELPQLSKDSTARRRSPLDLPTLSGRYKMTDRDKSSLLQRVAPKVLETGGAAGSRNTLFGAGHHSRSPARGAQIQPVRSQRSSAQVYATIHASSRVQSNGSGSGDAAISPGPGWIPPLIGSAHVAFLNAPHTQHVSPKEQTHSLTGKQAAEKLAAGRDTYLLSDD